LGKIQKVPKIPASIFVILPMSPLLRTTFLLAVFSIAMGFLESSVVIYLRDLYYPAGFKFPLVPIPANVALVEFFREAATIIMLLCIGILAGKNTAERFSFFLFCFAVWDLCYYLFLKIFLGWPQSWFTPDILFIIPVPWVGPVIAPCIVSATMIIITLLVVYFHQRDILVTVSRGEWILLVTGSLVIIFSFTLDYFHYISLKNDTAVWTPMSDQGLFSDVSSYVPQSFNWIVFIAGESVLIGAITSMVRRHRKLHLAKGTN
jgi:hypothetical protein